jgi:hypothetical protein
MKCRKSTCKISFLEARSLYQHYRESQGFVFDSQLKQFLRSNKKGWR